MRTSLVFRGTALLAFVLPLAGCPINKNDGANPVACECETVGYETGDTGSDTADSGDTADTADTADTGGGDTADTAAAGPRLPPCARHR